MSRFNIGAVLTAYYEIPAQSKDDAREWAYSQFPTETEITLADGTPIKIHFSVDDVHTITSIDLMDTSNNHDAELVKRINKAWDEKQKAFVSIVGFLAKQQISEWAYPEYHAKLSSFERCREYCQCFADNNDLETILSYCRM